MKAKDLITCIDFLEYPLDNLPQIEQANTMIELFWNDKKTFERIAKKNPLETATALKLLLNEDPDGRYGTEGEIRNFIDNLPPPEKIKKKARNYHYMTSILMLGGLTGTVYSTIYNNDTILALSLADMIPALYSLKKFVNNASEYLSQKILRSVLNK